MTSFITYTDDQLETYLDRIGYSSPENTSRLVDVKSRIQDNPLSVLADLQKLQLCTVPWGNSSLHYTQHHTISIDPQSVFHKLVHRQLDGYCMENTNLFYGVLRSLGYQVYPTGGRVSHAAAAGNDNGLYLAFGHMILIVTIKCEKYMVDVGFGNNCTTSPLPLRDNATASCIAPSEMRLVRDSLMEFTDKSQKVWIYQTRNNPESDWIPNIAFSEVEFLLQDFVVMNFSVSKSPTSWFTQRVVCVKMIMDENGTEIKGQNILAGTEMKRRVRGQTEALATFKTEKDRVDALAKWFGVHLRDYEAKAIRGMISMIR